MKKINRFFSLILMIISLTVFSGCFSYEDINRLAFATSIIFDSGEGGDTVIYLDCAKPYRSANESSEKGRRIIYKGKGKTVFEAIRNANLSSSSRISLTQCRAYIFSEKAARDGVERYIDFLDRENSVIKRPDVFVYFGDVENLLKTVEGDEEYLGVYISDLVAKTNTTPRTIDTSLNDYLTLRTSGANVIVIGALEMVKDVKDKRVELRGGAVLSNDKLAAKIDVDEAQSYNFLNDKVRSGTLEINNPQNSDSFITLEIVRSKTKTDLKYDGERIKLHKDLFVRCNIAEAQKRFLVNEEVLKFLKKNEEENIKKYLGMVFEQYKSKELDVFQIGRMLEIKYPNTVVKGDPLAITDLVVNVNVDIEGPSTNKDTY
ncbi:germination protein [Clostridium polyendosporum]|uniref:Germination protein n=1 Tax=Clostridium polyendosporum TaxID=69208 RepID=A0A919VGR6_9CLOT|nr:Ger(x)C family spore germination protein [Clostridium polyendosporum]GIM29462.1 germination protein [Clostridium polyendosporum]